MADKNANKHKKGKIIVASDNDDGHDRYDEDGYKRRCHCEKCIRTYDEWCKKRKEQGVTHCKRKCYTICEIKCEKPVTTTFNWGYKKEYEGKWESYHNDKPVPKPCNSCKKEGKSCSCKKD
jgi:hypothetical protein